MKYDRLTLAEQWALAEEIKDSDFFFSIYTTISKHIQGLLRTMGRLVTTDEDDTSTVCVEVSDEILLKVFEKWMQPTDDPDVRSLSFGISDLDEISSFILNHDEAGDYLRGLAQAIRDTI